MPSTAQLYHKYIDRKALLTVCRANETQRTTNGVTTPVERKLGMQVPVHIVDARMVYGREQVLVRPHLGVGSTWVEATDYIRVVEEFPNNDKATQTLEGPAN